VASFDSKILVTLGYFLLQPGHNTYQVDDFFSRCVQHPGSTFRQHKRWVGLVHRAATAGFSWECTIRYNLICTASWESKSIWLQRLVGKMLIRNTT